MKGPPVVYVLLRTEGWACVSCGVGRYRGGACAKCGRRAARFARVPRRLMRRSNRLAKGAA